MESMKDLPKVSREEEILHSASHGVGAIASLFGLVILCYQGIKEGLVGKLIANVVFGVSLVVLYTISALYHGITQPKAKKFLRYCDHCSIFLLIAGSYTPIAIDTLGEPIGTIVFCVLWGMAFFGIFMKIKHFDSFETISTYYYVVMGWIVGAFSWSIFRFLSMESIIFMVVGGIAYTVGAWVYTFERRYMHFVFHLFVLLGSVLHFIAICYFPRVN